MKVNFRWISPFIMLSDKITIGDCSHQFKIEIEREDLLKNMVLVKYKKDSNVFRFLFKKTNEQIDEVTAFCQRIIDNPDISPLDLE
jgi:hypothetical protein